MITRENYEILRSQYGSVSSWAVWRPAGATVKSNTESLAWVNDPDLLQILNTGFVFVGLNGSSTHGEQNGHVYEDWANFHSGYAYQNDFKLRYALQGTRYWGSYITDVIKHFSEVDSNKVSSYLNRHPEVVRSNIEELKNELSYLGGRPVLVSMGDKTYQILKGYLGNEYKIVKIKHYSFTINKDDYRTEVLQILDSL